MPHPIRSLFLLLPCVGLAGTAPAADTKALSARLAELPAVLVKNKKSDEQIAKTLFGEALNRTPTEMEQKTAAAHLAKAKNREEGIRDILWALANTKEFMNLHGLTVAEAQEIGEKVANPKPAK